MGQHQNNAVDPATIISKYESMSELMGQMVVAARAGDWDALLALESSCTALVNALKCAEPGWPLSESLRDRKSTLIRKMLSDDAQIRNLTEPWLSQLGSLIGNTTRRRKLTRTYEP
jgi:flagellar protein FliT